MASIIPRTAFRASRPLYSAISTPAPGSGKSEAAASGAEMAKAAKKNPELYVLFGVMAGIFGIAGWHFTTNPTLASGGRESKVAKVPNSEPWVTGKNASYQYHPYGDTTKAKKDAPSPLYVSIIPNVSLPKELHDQFNRYGKDGYP